MKSDEEFREEYGEDPDGIVTEFISIGADEGKVLIKLPVESTMVGKSNNDRMSQLMIAAYIYAGLFKEVPGEVDEENVDVYLEVDKEILQDEWQVAIDESLGGFYKFEDREPTDQEKHLGRVVIKEDDNNDE